MGYVEEAAAVAHRRWNRPSLEEENIPWNYIKAQE